MQESLAIRRGRPRATLPGGISLGLAAAALSGAAWFVVVAVTNRHLSALAMLVGPAVAYAVVFGASRRRGVAVQVVSVTITLGTLLVVESFSMRLLAVRELQASGETVVLGVFLGVRAMWNLVAAGITADPPTVLFWAVSLYYAVSVPARRDTGF